MCVCGEITQRKKEGEEEKKEAGIVAFAVSSPPADRIYSPPPHPDLLFLMTMPGWRRNLTFCLQRMHEDGRKAKQIMFAPARACVRACAGFMPLKCVLTCEQFVSGDTFDSSSFCFAGLEFSGSLEVRARFLIFLFFWRMCSAG